MQATTVFQKNSGTFDPILALWFLVCMKVTKYVILFYVTKYQLSVSIHVQLETNDRSCLLVQLPSSSSRFNTGRNYAPVIESYPIIRRVAIWYFDDLFKSLSGISGQMQVCVIIVRLDGSSILWVWGWTKSLERKRGWWSWCLHKPLLLLQSL